MSLSLPWPGQSNFRRQKQATAAPSLPGLKGHRSSGSETDPDQSKTSGMPRPQKLSHPGRPKHQELFIIRDLICIRIRGCTLDGYKNLQLCKDLKSVILEIWAAPGAPDTLAKGGGRSPPPFGRVSGAPGAAQTPNMTDFRPLNNLSLPPKV